MRKRLTRGMPHMPRSECGEVFSTSHVRISHMKHRNERLFAKAEEILGGKANGFGEPILRHLALRQYGPAMLSYACRMTSSGSRAELGRKSDTLGPVGLMYRAFRAGELNAAQNLALTYFYVGDLAGYRFWLRRAGQAGDEEAAQELRRFETRQPWPLARKIRRLRPFRRDER